MTGSAGISSSVTGQRAKVPFIGGFESTYLPAADRDVAELTGGARNWRQDLEAMSRAGVRRVRFPIRWHRLEEDRGTFNWSETDRQLDDIRRLGMEPIVDLVHHTSYPRWLSDGFRDRRFGPAYIRYAEAVARRYPWLTSYTLFNEPFATLFLGGHEALWPPYDSGIEGFARLLNNVLPALRSAANCWSGLLPDARHVWVDTCEHHRGAPGGPADHAALANDRRHVVLDLALGHDLNPERPFLQQLLSTGCEELLDADPIRVDVLGLDYYCHSEWWYDESGGHAPSPHPRGFAALAGHYGERYGLPMLLSETNIRGTPADRCSWLRYTLEQYEAALRRGVRLEGYCWFPYLDSCDWDSLLALSAGRTDPVGVVGAGPDGSRMRSSFTAVWEAAAAGAPSRDLPAYRFQAPCHAQLTGLLPQMNHWAWQDPPINDHIPPVTVPQLEEHALPTPLHTDLVVLSHLRWTWVWQRPQHLVSRFAAARAGTGARTWFIEEPLRTDVSSPQLRHEQMDGITRVWLELPAAPGQTGSPGFTAEGAPTYGELIRRLFESEQRPPNADILLYTPMALDIARLLSARVLVYDVMDDLSSFRHAPEGLKLRQRQLLAEADVVFTGGRTLHQSVSQQRGGACYLFPSGVETAHYAASKRLHRQPAAGRPKVAGYVGVIDERIDLQLLQQLAAALPDWRLEMIGPVAKIDPASLPQAPNLLYRGMAAYRELPSIMAGFDVALMPFALNEATRSISPTKTLEYLAAGLPVVSTPIADVAADYAGVVQIAGDPAGFAQACRMALLQAPQDRDRKIGPILKLLDWDAVARQMHTLIEHGSLSIQGKAETA